MISFYAKKVEIEGGKLKVAIPPSVLRSGAVDKMMAQVIAGKELHIRVGVPKKKRTLDQNAALWWLLQEMARVLGTTAEEVYIEMLKRYGYFFALELDEKAKTALQRTFKIVEEMESIVVDGKRIVLFKCIRGTSTYDTKEFTAFFDRVIEEAKEIDVWFSEADRQLLESWKTA